MHGSWRDIVSFLCLGPSCFMKFEPIAWRSANLVFVVLKLTCLGVSLKKSCLVYGGLLLFMVLAPFSLMWLVYLPLSVFVLIFGFFPEEAVTSSYLAVRKARFYLLLFLWSALLVGFLWEWPGVYYAARVSLLVVYVPTCTLYREPIRLRSRSSGSLARVSYRTKLVARAHRRQLRDIVHVYI